MDQLNRCAKLMIIENLAQLNILALTFCPFTKTPIKAKFLAFIVWSSYILLAFQKLAKILVTPKENKFVKQIMCYQKCADEFFLVNNPPICNNQQLNSQHSSSLDYLFQTKTLTKNNDFIKLQQVLVESWIAETKKQLDQNHTKYTEFNSNCLQFKRDLESRSINNNWTKQLIKLATEKGQKKEIQQIQRI